MQPTGRISLLSTPPGPLFSETQVPFWPVQACHAEHSVAHPLIVYSFNKSWRLYVCAYYVASVVSDSVTLWIVAYQAPLSMGFSRQEYWGQLPCPPPRDLPNQGIEPMSPMSPEVSSIHFSHSVVSDSLQPHDLQHIRLSCPSPTPRACSNSCPSSQ